MEVLNINYFKTKHTYEYQEELTGIWYPYTPEYEKLFPYAKIRKAGGEFEYTEESAKRFALKHFHELFLKFANYNGHVPVQKVNESILEVCSSAVECGFKFGQKSIVKK